MTSIRTSNVEENILTGDIKLTTFGLWIQIASTTPLWLGVQLIEIFSYYITLYKKGDAADFGLVGYLWLS